MLQGGEALVQERLPDDDFPPDHKSGFAALIGHPDARKSTLMNSLLSQEQFKARSETLTYIGANWM